jgi:hypothetical protein
MLGSGKPKMTVADESEREKRGSYFIAGIPCWIEKGSGASLCRRQSN